jgi:hypothetical protein
VLTLRQASPAFPRLAKHLPLRGHASEHSSRTGTENGLKKKKKRKKKKKKKKKNRENQSKHQHRHSSHGNGGVPQIDSNFSVFAIFPIGFATYHSFDSFFVVNTSNATFFQDELESQAGSGYQTDDNMSNHRKYKTVTKRENTVMS